MQRPGRSLAHKERFRTDRFHLNAKVIRMPTDGLARSLPAWTHRRLVEPSWAILTLDRHHMDKSVVRIHLDRRRVAPCSGYDSCVPPNDSACSKCGSH
jgi:hypothetical protein